MLYVFVIVNKRPNPTMCETLSIFFQPVCGTQPQVYSFLLKEGVDKKKKKWPHIFTFIFKKALVSIYSSRKVHCSTQVQCNKETCQLVQ